MRSSYLFEIKRSDVVPREGRAAWLDKWGKVPAKIEVSASAELCDWEGAVGVAIRDDGSIAFPGSDTYGVRRDIVEAIIDRLRANPEDLTDMDVTEILRSDKAQKAEGDAKFAAEEARKAAEWREAIAFVESLPVTTTRADIAEMDAPDRSKGLAYLALDAVVNYDTKYWSLNHPEARVVSDWIEATAAYRRDQAAAIKAEKDRQESEHAAAVREWVVTHPDNLPPRIVRAARDGIDVRKELRAAIHDRIVATLAAGYTTIDARTVDDDDRVPTDRAYEIRDAIESVTTAIEDAALVACTATVVGFVRVDVATADKSVWRSAVDVAVTSPLFPDDDLGTYVLTEPLAWPTKDSDDPDDDQ